MPLADKVRPKCLEDIVGQKHIIGKNRFINNMLERGFLPNLIFYGPPGTGKTTTAEIIAMKVNKKFYKMNATNSSVSEIKKVVEDLNKLDSRNGVVLYIDEIQSFNKKQQQAVLEYIEKGSITLIASTTENPYHYLFKAILSRSTILEFKTINDEDIYIGLKNIVKKLKEESFSDFEISDGALKEISFRGNGDMRTAINILETAVYSRPLGFEGEIDSVYIKNMPIDTVMNFDSDGDVHYDLLSAFQKSIRGSDPDAAVHYLARLIKGGDLISICRRLLVIASEDIGLAYPMAQVIVKSCVDAAFQLGFPEARIPLAQATVLLATSPKSNSSYMAINRALSDLDEYVISDVPGHLKDAHYSGAEKLERGEGYKYPHNYENSYVPQQYLPDSIKDRKYYEPKNNKFENGINQFMKKLKEK